MELRDYVRIFRRRWRSVAFLVVLGVAAGLAFTLLSPKVFAAQSKVYVKLARVNPATAYQGNQYVLGQMPSYAQLNGSPEVLGPVISELGLNESTQKLASQVTISTPASTTYLDVDVTAGSSRQAKRIAAAAGKQLASVIVGLQATETSTHVVAANAQGVTGSGAAVSPKLPLDVALGFILGLILGLILAIVRNRLDTSIRGAETLRDLTGVPALAVLPDPQNLTAGVGDEPEADLSRAHLSAYRALRTDLALASGGHLPPSIVVVAVDSEDGPNVALNLAHVAARSGIKTCLVEADLRKPQLGAILSSRTLTGLTAVLEGRADLVDAVIAWPIDPDREPAVLAAGEAADDPADLLDSAAMARTHRVLAASFDLVVYISPSGADGSDAVILARDCAAALLVVRAGSSGRTAFAATAEALAAVGATISGAVVVEALRRRAARRRGHKRAAGVGESAPLSTARPRPVALVEATTPFEPAASGAFAIPSGSQSRSSGSHRTAAAARVPVMTTGLPPRARSSRARRAPAEVVGLDPVEPDTAQPDDVIESPDVAAAVTDDIDGADNLDGIDGIDDGDAADDTHEVENVDDSQTEMAASGSVPSSP